MRNISVDLILRKRHGRNNTFLKMYKISNFIHLFIKLYEIAPKTHTKFYISLTAKDFVKISEFSFSYEKRL